MNNSAIGSITIKVKLKHHWGGGKTALGFGPDRIRTLVSMETDSSHRIMGKSCGYSSGFLFDRIVLIFAEYEVSHKVWKELEL